MDKLDILNFISELFVTVLHVLVTTIVAIITWMVPTGFRTKSLEGETMLITGAGSGIGRLFAQKFSALGVRVVLWDIDGASVEETARIVRQNGGKAWWFVCDVTKRNAVNETALKVKNEVGGVTMLINNAGVIAGKNFLDLTEDDFQRTINVNSMAHIWTLKAFIPDMLERNHGHIITVASILGEIVVPGAADYCMSKFAAIGLHECVQREVRAQGKDGIHFTLVNPYKIDTGMFDGAEIKKGCQIIFPTLKPDYLVKKAVEAVLTNQDVIRAPFIFNIVVLLYKLLPLKAILLFEDFIEYEKVMDQFVGRRGRNAISQTSAKLE